MEYLLTITVGDGTNDANAVTYTITVTDVVIDISAASATILKQQLMVHQLVMLASPADSATAAGFTISAGNANGAFAVTYAWSSIRRLHKHLSNDYETATSQTVTFTITDGSNYS